MWTINGIRIYVDEHDEGGKHIIARLNPFDNGTILHYFGYDDPIVKISGTIIGTTDRDAIKNLVGNGSSYTLVSPEGSSTVIVNSYNFKRIPSIRQTVRDDLASDSPVYRFEMELYGA